MSASKKALGDLHTALAKTLKDAIDTMDMSDKGNAAILNVARQFLKDNGIEAVPAEGSPTGALAAKLNEYPFDPQADGVH
ncbi:hypothetical protein [Luteibacter sp. ME-Dv--P-043b]|jgi:hypothetical protein|uniref:hypothetical protein n=1 Tax=Luteibacter sp. ME-Dv--P-043b TaxID=3040291 RepID=UPI00255301BB|nr:hypothetical protein [Luteibacter sp. ME-Dv--P-043b]